MAEAPDGVDAGEGEKSGESLVLRHDGISEESDKSWTCC